MCIALLTAACGTSQADEPMSSPASRSQAAISWIDDDFSAFDSVGNVSARYQLLRDFALSRGIAVDFALVPFSYPASEWLPERRIATLHQWRDEGFGFLHHPVHWMGWYRYDSSHPHDVGWVRLSIEDCRAAFDLYGLESPPILVWPGNSSEYGDNLPIVKQYYECAITSTYNRVNDYSTCNHYALERLSLECLKTGELTVSQFKQRIKKAVDAGKWIILASHFYSIEIADTVTETGYTTANVFAIVQYAQSLCPLQHTATVWEQNKKLITP